MSEIKQIEGGICAAEGFFAAGIHCGIRPNKSKNDLALIYSKKECNTVGLFTKNKVKAAPVILDIETLKKSSPRAVAVNSGNANACAEDDILNAERMQKIFAEKLGISCDEVLVSSTGVIGQRLNIEAIEAAAPVLVSALSRDSAASDSAATAIMTTDTVKKELAFEFELDGKPVRIGGISKGSGMIHPNMGTMLCYITTDCNISREMLQQAIIKVCNISFNRISVDGDTSTNDSLIIMANGAAENELIDCENDAYMTFVCALQSLCISLARQMAADGEGAKHLITCNIGGAKSEDDAVALSKSVISSTLTKAAIFGNDANWGRVLCAMGYSGVDFDPTKVDISFASVKGSIEVCKNGKGIAFDEDAAFEILSEKEIDINISLSEGDSFASCYGCDITYEYIKINGEYRT